CGTIEKIDECLTIDNLSTGNECSDDVLYTAYCPTNKEDQKGQCVTNGEKISAGFIWLLTMLEALNEECPENEKDHYFEYAILWLSSKGNIIKPGAYVSIDGIYDILERNNSSWYNQFRDKLNEKKKSMNFSNYHMCNLYKLLNELCTLITKYNHDRSNPEAYLGYANNFAETYKNYVTNSSKVQNCESYCDVLSTLKSEYDNFKEENKDLEGKLPEINETETCKDLCKQKKQKTENDKGIGDGLDDGKVDIDDGTDDNQRNQEESRNGQGATDSVPGEKETKSTPGITFYIGQFVYTSVLNSTFNFVETYKEQIINISKGIPDVYNKTLNIIKNGFSKSTNFFNEIIGSISSSSKKVEISGSSGNKRQELDGAGDESPSSDDSSSPQKHTLQASSSSSSTEQTKTSESSQGPTVKTNSDQTDQEKPQAQVPKSVIKLKNPVTEVTGNGTKGIDVNILKRYKSIGISIIMFLIPITLLILYKYFPFGWRKELKKKKNMKKVINMFGANETTKRVINTTDRKKQVQIIINSSTQKKQDKKVTNSSIQKKQDKKITNSSTQKKQDKMLTNSSTQKKQDKKFTNSS
ncbi:BIR protein, partial [Plasmodium berghei]